jgi:hypothetical protein
MTTINPRDLKDSRINEAIVESDSRLLLHLRDGRAVAITATDENAPDGAWGSDYGARLNYELVNP